MSKVLVIGMTALVVLAAVVVGFLAGKAQAPDRSEWSQARAGAKDRALASAERRAFQRAKDEAFQVGLQAGRTRGTELGAMRGKSSGEADAQEQLVAIEEEEVAALEYTSSLPNGDPGYLLPEEERTLACVGYSVIDGECVGD